jgi:hypothetical protein
MEGALAHGAFPKAPRPRRFRTTDWPTPHIGCAARSDSAPRGPVRQRSCSRSRRADGLRAPPTAVELAWGTLRPGTLGPGFPADEYLSARLEVESEGGGATAAEPATTGAGLRDLRDELLRSIEAEPGVIAATAAGSVPGEEPFSFARIESAADAAQTGQPAFVASAQIRSARIGSNFLEALDLPVLAGRGFDAGDFAEGDSAILVDRTFVQEALEGRNPLGLRLRYLSPAARGDQPMVRWFEIVGVVGDLPANRLSGKIYHPARRDGPPALTIIARTAPGSLELSGRIREIAASLQPRVR